MRVCERERERESGSSVHILFEGSNTSSVKHGQGAVEQRITLKKFSHWISKDSRSDYSS